MPSDKDRLYIGLYARDVPNTYHWAFLKTPKAATDTPKETIRYHVASRPAKRDSITKDTWFFEKRELVSLKTQMLLVRVLVAKVEGLKKTWKPPYSMFQLSRMIQLGGAGLGLEIRWHS